MIKISPSILSADFSKMAEEIRELEKWGADWIHCDVMDGMFVPNITFGPKMIADIKKQTRLPLDVHLMINDPGRYIDAFADAGADILTVHTEAAVHLDRVIGQIKAKGVKCAAAVNPATPVEALKCIAGELDMILIMTVNPGFGGQRFIEYSYDKIKAARKMAGKDIPIEVDGGVSPANAAKLYAAGADVFVAGSSVFTAEDPAAAIRRMKLGEKTV